MKTLAAEQRELIDAVVAERDVGNITAAIFEKDVHITDTLRALFEHPLQTKGAELVFCGGTSLSKGFGWTNRMSEDLDFKVCAPAPLSKSARKQVRSEVQERLEELGLLTEPERWRAHDNSRHIVMEWQYEPQYGASTALRPHLQIELRFDDVKRQPVLCPVSTLLGQYLGAEIPDHLDGPASAACQQASETLAEKVMAYLRRSLSPEAERDRSLARHLYDVHAMTTGDPDLLNLASELFPAIAAEEQRSYRKQFSDTATMRRSLETALAVTENQDLLREEYDREVAPLLFSREQADFENILQGFRRAAQHCIATLPHE